MLSVGSRFAPIDRAGRVSHRVAVKRYVLAVALHSQLLQVRWKSLQILLVRQYRDGLRAEEAGVPYAQQANQDRQIAIKRRAAEMFVETVEAVQHRAKMIGADGQHGGKADRRIHGIASADPIPK